MANPPRSQHLRQMIAQQAARMLAEDGAQDYAYAKRKAARQLGSTDDHCLPTNAEIEQELSRIAEVTGTSYTADYQDGDPTTRFQTKTGVRYNQLPTSPFPTLSFTPAGRPYQ